MNEQEITIHKYFGFSLGMDKELKEFYNYHVEDEDQRLDYHAFELPVTLHYIRKYLSKGSRILDVACGTGRYAEALLDEGYLLGLNDISDKNITKVKARLKDKMQNVLFIQQQDAFEKEIWKNEQWDGILILGPLYHAVDFKLRLKLLQSAKKALRKDGFIFSGFMSRVGALVFGMLHYPQGILEPEGAQELWEKGSDRRFINKTYEFKGSHAYFAQPEEIDSLITDAGLKPLKLIGIEGIFGERFDAFHQMEKKQQRAWLDFIIRHSEEKAMIYQSKHLLSISMG